MNFEHIKRLLECNRHGEVIRLMRDNIHTWSMNDYDYLYDLCYGCKKIMQFVRPKCYKQIFAEPCIIYVLDHLCVDNIHGKISKYLRMRRAYSYGATRIIRRKIDHSIFRGMLCYNDDTIMYFIKKKQVSEVYNIIKYNASKWYFYDDYDIQNYLITKFKEKEIYAKLINSYKNINDRNMLNDFCRKIMLTCKSVHPIHYIYRYRDLHIHIYNNDFTEFRKAFRDNGFGREDYDNILILRCYSSPYYSSRVAYFVNKCVNEKQ
jgi:hypothetical protein